MKIQPFIFTLALFIGCGPSHLSTGPTVPTVVQVAEETQRSFVTMTDVETVLDVYDTPNRVWVATNLGLYEYAASGGAPQRAEWLPETSLQAVLQTDAGTLWAGGGDEIWIRATDSSVQRVTLGATLHDLEQSPDGSVYACTERGLWRSGANGWDRAELGLDHCSALFRAQAGVWVIGNQGRALIELSDTVAHNHHRALAELRPHEKTRVRAVAPLANGGVLALLATSSGAVLALYREGVWFTYTSLPFDGAVIGLAGTKDADKAWLVTTDGHFLIDVAEVGEGVAAVPVAVSSPERIAQWKPIWSGMQLKPAPVRPRDTIPQDDAARQPLRFVPAPSEPPDAPELRFALLDLPTPVDLPGVFAAHRGFLLAPAHYGLIRLHNTGEIARYQTGSLLPSAGADYRLSLAHSSRGPALRTAAGRAAFFDKGRFIPVHLNEEVAIDALASRDTTLIGAGPSPTSETSIAIYEYQGGTFALARTVELGARVASVPHLGLSAEGDVWAALLVHTDDGKRAPRGVVWLPADGSEPVPFSSEVEAEEGARSKPAPDQVFDLDLGQGGFAWLATFSGAVRIGDDQVIVFGQARGVPGESVFDIRASDERMWLAAAGGLGVYDNRDLDFSFPELVAKTKVTRVATHEGHVWLAGPGGVARFDGRAWHRVALPDALLSKPLDVDIDQQGRVWLLLSDRLLLIDSAQR